MPYSTNRQIAFFPVVTVDRQRSQKSSSLQCTAAKLEGASSEAAHFLVGATLALPAVKSRELRKVLPAWTIPISSGILATVPDLDLAWKHIFGQVHANIAGHRGLFHSPFFLILASGVLAAIVAWHHSRKAFAGLWLLWAVCMITHPLLDALTTGGSGVMLLLPFTRAISFFLAPA